jgi:hypothetical protein
VEHEERKEGCEPLGKLSAIVPETIVEHPLLELKKRLGFARIVPIHRCRRLVESFGRPHRQSRSLCDGLDPVPMQHPAGRTIAYPQRVPFRLVEIPASVDNSGCCVVRMCNLDPVIQGYPEHMPEFGTREYLVPPVCAESQDDIVDTRRPDCLFGLKFRLCTLTPWFGYIAIGVEGAYRIRGRSENRNR